MTSKDNPKRRKLSDESDGDKGLENQIDNATNAMDSDDGSNGTAGMLINTSKRDLDSVPLAFSIQMTNYHFTTYFGTAQNQFTSIE